MPQTDRFIRITWWIAIVTVVLNCVFWFSYWSLIDVATPFAVPILRLPVLVVTFVAVVAAVILPFRRWKPCGIATLLPLGFLIGCFGLSRLVDFTDVWLAANFRLRLADREEVVGLIASGKLRPNVRHNSSLIALPSEFAAVSLGGVEVVVERNGDQLKVLFFTFRGVLDSFAGFVYTSDDSAPTDGDFAGRFAINRRLEERWHYVSAH
jgi:hypothetical protein